ncbi:Protein FAR1-RELATED SEQUENCE 5 [Bienertia sinuspersici]
MPMSRVMRTTSRLDSENNFFGHFTTPHVTLLEFWMRYQSAMDCQRHKQSKLLSESKNSKPQRKTRLDLEKHASELYTHTVFYEFQNELLAACCNCGLHSMIPEEDVQIVTLIDHKRKQNAYNKTHPMGDQGKRSEILACSLSQNTWIKEAMNMPMFDLGGNLIEDTTKMEAVKMKVGYLWSEIFTCVSMDENNEDCLDDFMKLIDGFKQSLLSRGDLQASADKGKQMETLLDCPLPEEITILDPNK